MVSRRDDLDLVVGYELGFELDPTYTAFRVMQRGVDGLELLEAKEGSFTRAEMLEAILDAIIRFAPRSVAVMVGDSDPVMVSSQTVEAILKGHAQWYDLYLAP